MDSVMSILTNMEISDLKRGNPGEWAVVLSSCIDMEADTNIHSSWMQTGLQIHYECMESLLERNQTPEVPITQCHQCSLFTIITLCI